MKYTIQGFSQKKIIEFNMDLTDVMILRWFIDFKDSGDMKKKIFENEMYYWIKYSKLISDIPVIKINNYEALGRRLKKLVRAGILISKIVKSYHGTDPYYGIGVNYRQLISKNVNTTFESNPPDSKVASAPDSKVASHIPIIDRSIKDSIQQQHISNNLLPICQHNEEEITNCKNDVDVENPIAKNITEEPKELTGVNTPVKKDFNKKGIVISQDDNAYLNMVRANFKVKHKQSLLEDKLREVFSAKGERGRELLDFYMEHFQEFIDAETKDIRTKGGLFIAMVRDEWPPPVGQKAQNKSIGSHPIQETNYEQREYDDEFFDSLYANRDYI